MKLERRIIDINDPTLDKHDKFIVELNHKLKKFIYDEMENAKLEPNDTLYLSVITNSLLSFLNYRAKTANKDFESYIKDFFNQLVGNTTSSFPKLTPNNIETHLEALIKNMGKDIFYKIKSLCNQEDWSPEDVADLYLNITSNIFLNFLIGINQNENNKKAKENIIQHLNEVIDEVSCHFSEKH